MVRANDVFLRDSQGWNAVQRLVNLRAATGRERDSAKRTMKTNLAAFVVPSVISAVCVLAGCIALHEYCAESIPSPGDAALFTPERPFHGIPRCFFAGEGMSSYRDSIARATRAMATRATKSVVPPSVRDDEEQTLAMTKIAAMSFYAASLFTTAVSGVIPGFRAGPLKTSLLMYHSMICLWSLMYYALDFFHLVPTVASERDGALEYSAMRVVAVWPVTSTLMISKIAMLLLTTRHQFDKEEEDDRVWENALEERLTGGGGGDDDDDGGSPRSAAAAVGGSIRGGRKGAESIIRALRSGSNRASGGAGAGTPTTNSGDRSDDGGGDRRRRGSGTGDECDSDAKTFGGVVGFVVRMMGHVERVFDIAFRDGAASFRKTIGEDEVMATAWDVWLVALVNNLMLLAGALGLLTRSYWVRVIALSTSTFLFLGLMIGFRVLFACILQRVRSPRDRAVLHSLERWTYVTWTLFPVIQGLREIGYIDTATQFLLMTAADMFAKLMYSVNLIYSNFWLINACDGLMRLDEGLFTDALELSRVSQLALRTLEKAKSEAESVSNLHRAFVANISHELRTPLNSIIAFNSMLLEDETLSEAQREFVSSAIVSAEALLGIIGQILDFAKLESGSDTHQELVVENFEVHEMMNELVDIVGHQANKNQVEMVVDVDPSLDGVVLRGDKFRLRQALINVTNNSIKFTREGGEVRVVVAAKPEDERERIAREKRERLARETAKRRSWATGLAITETRELSAMETAPGVGGDAGERNHPRMSITCHVVDDGIGIPDDKLGVVFMPFGQASIGSTREYGGTGLGLAITSNIMHALGGSIECASTLGRGTTMTLKLSLEIAGAGGSGSGSGPGPGPGPGGVATASYAPLPTPTYATPHTSCVATLVAKESLAAAIANVANAGGATSERLRHGESFPHAMLRHQTQSWASDVCDAVARVARDHAGAVSLVVDEKLLGAFASEWATRGVPMPPLVLIANKKITPHIAASHRAAAANGSDLDSAMYDSVVASATQVLRPVKPNLMRCALQRADASLASRAGEIAAAAARASGDGARGGGARATRSSSRQSGGAAAPSILVRRRGGAGRATEDRDAAPAAIAPPSTGRGRGRARRAPMQQTVSGDTVASFVTAAGMFAFKHGGRVLIVEDNVMNQKVARVVVKHCGMSSDLANNGKEAVDILRGGARYDAILMDVQMPVMDGLDATRKIREMEASGELPERNFILATSANATAENHQEGFAAGMDEYITKPIYPTKLKELLMSPRLNGAHLVHQIDDGGEAEVTSVGAGG